MRITRREKLFLLLKCIAIGTLLWILPLFFDIYADTTFPYIPYPDITSELVSYDGLARLQLCPNMGGHVPIQIPFNDASESWKNRLQPGGVWEPEVCQSQHKIAMIISYRNRSEHLQIFMDYMHRFLQEQNISYRIVLVEQSAPKAFNRGQLFNCGFQYVNTYWPENCFILHDVDLIPRDLRNTYACTKMPRHMVSSLNVFRFHLPYRQIFGGAIAISDTDFQLINGFSNHFWGWGGEDDDLMMRVTAQNISFVRFDPRVAVYTMLSHAPAKPSDDRWETLAQFDRQKVNGLTTVQCNIRNVTLNPSYTHLVIDL